MKQKKFERISREDKISLMFDLIGAFQTVKRPTETALLLQDLLTANEIRNLSIRLRIAKLILAGETHREIQRQLKTSLATVTKVRSWLDQGGEGFKRAISRLPLKWEIPKKIPKGPIEFHLPQTIFAATREFVAKSQNKRSKKFISSVEDRRKKDRGLQKQFDSYYKEQVAKRSQKGNR